MFAHMRCKLWFPGICGHNRMEPQARFSTVSCTDRNAPPAAPGKSPGFPLPRELL
jgi:hypothetical protein